MTMPTNSSIVKNGKLKLSKNCWGKFTNITNPMHSCYDFVYLCYKSTSNTNTHESNNFFNKLENISKLLYPPLFQNTVPIYKS